MAASALRWCDSLDIGHRDLIVLRALAGYADAKTLLAWPSLHTLEIATAYEKRTVQRALASLEANGFIRDARGEHGKRRKRAQKWELLMPARFELTPEDMQVIRRNVARRQFEEFLSPELSTRNDTAKEKDLPGEVVHGVVHRKAPSYPH